jgi:hypothetical protein
MAFRPNYRFERRERDRLKQVKKDEKLKRQQERASLRPDPGPAEATDERSEPKPDFGAAGGEEAGSNG